jgi:hypothetical protein
MRIRLKIMRQHRARFGKVAATKVAKVANFCGDGIGDLAVQNLVSKGAK